MDKSRQQFEEWFNEHGISTGWCSKRDLEFIKTKMFSCWQASRESLEVELPKKYLGEYTRNKTINECKNILISNGVKIKNE